jgi:hypothetical protein
MAQFYGGKTQSIGRYLDFYNRRRPHSNLDGMTPDRAYFTPLSIRMAAWSCQTIHLSQRADFRDHLTACDAELCFANNKICR